jgi:hypothetical protein
MVEFKEEMTVFKKETTTTLFNLDTHARETNHRLDKIEEVLPPLVTMSKTMEGEIHSINLRFKHSVDIKK